MPSISRDLIITVVKASRGHVFEANGANIIARLMENIDFSIVKTVTIDFVTVEAISTSFGGRLKEHVSEWKSKNSKINVKVVNAKRPVMEVLKSN